MIATFITASVKFSSINTYNPAITRSYEETEKPYHDLSTSISHLESKGHILVLGDSNVRLEGKLAHESDTIGGFMFGRCNEHILNSHSDTFGSRQLFITFRKDHDLPNYEYMSRNILTNRLRIMS